MRRTHERTSSRGVARDHDRVAFPKVVRAVADHAWFWLAGLLVVGAVVCAGLGPASASASADQLRGAVANDVFQTQTIGSAAFEAWEASGGTGGTTLIYSGQQADTPESIGAVSAELAALKAAGADTVRFTIQWTALETDGPNVIHPGSPPSWNSLAVARLDAIFAAIHASGLKALVNFTNTSCARSSYWATTPSVADCSNLGPWFSYPPTDESDLTAAIKQLIANWGSDIYAIEVWNEPNNSQFFLYDKSQCDPTAPADLYGASADATRAAAYVPMVKAVWNAVQNSADPGIQVIADGSSLSDTTFLQDLYTDGMKGYYNAISIHPYQLQVTFNPVPQATASDPCGERNAAEQIYTTQDPTNPFSNPVYSFTTGVEAIHSVMQQNADSSPLWLTEFGFDGCSAVPAQAPAELGLLSGQVGNGKDWTGTCTTWGPQGTWLAESFKIASEWPYVAAAIMYQVHDGVAGENQFSTDNWGLLRHDFAPKPAMVDVTNEWSCLRQGTC